MNEPSRNVFFVISSLPAQGGNASIELLAPALRRHGFAPVVFVHRPAKKDNQYLQSLLRAGIPVFQWPIWQPPQWLVDRFGVLVALALPLRIFGALLYRLLLGRSLSRSWQRFPARLEYFFSSQLPRAVQPFFFGPA